MSKKTITENIYDMILNGPKVSKEEALQIIDEMSKEFAKVLIERLVERTPRKPFHLRMSNIGTKPRQLWFNLKFGKPEDDFNKDSAMRFLAGALTEVKLITLVRLAGYKVHSQQKKVSFCGVDGSIDGYIDDTLTDFKSASDQSFKKFKDGKGLHTNDPFGYIGQLSGYSNAEGVKEALFLVENKNSGEIAEYWIDSFDIKSMEHYIPELLKMMEAPEPPEDKCYKPKTESETKKQYLSTNCKYCPHINKCWGDAIEDPQEDYKNVKKIYLK